MKLKILNIILFLLFSIETFSQIDESYIYYLGLDINNKVIQGTEADSLIPYPNKIKKDWKTFEHKKNRQELDFFIFNNKKYFAEFIKPTFSSYNLKQLRKLLHFVDINNDGKLDVIFEIDKPWDDFFSVLIFLCVSKDKYKIILDIPRFIDGFEFKDKKLSKIYIVKPGCCDERNTLKYEFSFKYSNQNIPKITRTHFSIEKYYVQKLDSSSYNQNITVKKATNLKVIELRSSPLNVDSLIDYYEYTSRVYEDMGNVIATLKPNSKFLILGKKTDDKHKNWFYIQFLLRNLTSDKNEFEYYHKTFSTLSGYGWIKEEDIIIF